MTTNCSFFKEKSICHLLTGLKGQLSLATMGPFVKDHWKGLSLLAIFAILSLFFSYYLFSYYIGIFCVNPGEFGELIWCSSGPGTFFPFPRESGHEAAFSYSYAMIDYLLYFLLISTNLVYLLPVFCGFMTLVIALKLFNNYRSETRNLR